MVQAICMNRFSHKKTAVAWLVNISLPFLKPTDVRCRIDNDSPRDPTLQKLN